MKTYDPSTQLRANFLSVLLKLPWCLLLSHTFEVPVILFYIYHSLPIFYQLYERTISMQ